MSNHKHTSVSTDEQKMGRNFPQKYRIFVCIEDLLVKSSEWKTSLKVFQRITAESFQNAAAEYIFFVFEHFDDIGAQFIDVI